MNTEPKLMLTDVFVAGARKGWIIATTNTLPNVLMAFVIIKALTISGALGGLAVIFAPLMKLFGLPGEAAAVLLGSWMSMGGGVGVAVSLFDSGILTGMHLAILAPAIYLMGSQIQFAGRIIGVVGISAKLIPVMMLISIFNAFIAMLLMRFII